MLNIKPQEIPLGLFGKQEFGVIALEYIKKTLKEFPDKPLSVKKLSDETGIIPIKIKNLLFYLITIQELGVTFRALHKSCGAIISEEFRSIHSVRSQLLSKFGTICKECQKNIISLDVVTIEMRFWNRETVSMNFR